MNEELCKITMFPIALLSTIDFITNVYAVPMIQFEIHVGRYELYLAKNNYPYQQIVNQAYEARDLFFDLFDKPYKLMLTLGYLFGNHLFILSCVPWFILHRVNEYFYGSILSFVAIERYILICRPFDAKRLLTDTNRKRVLMILTGLLMMLTFVDLFLRYKFGQYYWSCVIGFTSKNYFGSITFAIFFVVPFFLVSFLNLNIIRALLNQKQEKERNLNLTVLFLTSSLVWGISCLIKYFLQHVVIANSTDYHRTQLVFTFWPYLDVQSVQNIGNALLLAPTINSFLNPIIILTVNRNVRRPIAKFFSCLTMKWSR